MVVQSDAFPDGHASVVICPMTSSVADAPDFRVTIDPSVANGLRKVSQVMADKPTTVRRERIGLHIGNLAQPDLRRLNQAMAFSLGLAD